MTTALDCAHYFVQRGLDDPRDTFDGNMKLQKLLFFADMISLAETGKPLFDDPVYAFDKGCVVEAVRPHYRDDNKAFVAESEQFDASVLTERERDILDLTIEIYGPINAPDLSENTHEYPCWRNAHDRYLKTNSKTASIITVDEMMADIDRIREIVDIGKDLREQAYEREVINGISFYYDPKEVTMDDKLREELMDYAKYTDETALTITYCGDEMVIY